MQCSLLLETYLDCRLPSSIPLVTSFLALSILRGHYLFLQFGAKLLSNNISLSFTSPAPGTMPGTPEVRTGRKQGSTPLGCGQSWVKCAADKGVMSWGGPSRLPRPAGS